MALARLSLIGFLAYGSYAICRTPLLPLLARDLGAAPQMVGLVVAASTVTGILVKLPAGAWSDVLGRRPLLIAGMVIFAAMPFTYLAVGSLGLLLLVRFVHGSATAIAGPVMSATLSDLAPPARRATWLSTYATCQGAGQAMGPVIAGLLIARGRFDLAFAAAGAIALATPLLVAGQPPAQRPPAAAAGPNLRLFAEGIRAVAGDRRILLASVTHAAHFMLHGTLSAFLPLYARDEIGLSAAEIGWLFGLQMVTTLATRPLIGMASDRLGRRGAIAAGLVACAAAVCGISIAESRGELLAAVLAYAGGVALTTAAASAYVTDIAPRARYGAAHGVFGTIYDVGDAAGPLLAGVLVAAWGYAVTFQIVAAIAAIMALIFYTSSRSAVRPAKQGA